MTIETKHWYAQNNKMPGATFFRVCGRVTVNSPAIEATLVPYEGPAPKDLVVRLSLQLTKLEGNYITVVTEKDICYVSEVLLNNAPAVEIFHEGQVIARVNIVETH